MFDQLHTIHGSLTWLYLAALCTSPIILALLAGINSRKRKGG